MVGGILSPSSRRAWIEIPHYFRQICDELVALLAEGVDRNAVGFQIVQLLRVALLAEGVDRNKERGGGKGNLKESPSSRRAWIEILVRL